MKTFVLFDPSGNPVAGAVVSFAYFGDRSGSPLLPPSIVYLGNGNYGFDDAPFLPPTLSAHTVYLLQTDKSPKWLFGALYPPNDPFAALFFTKPVGDLPWDGVAFPTVLSYRSFPTGTPLVPQPTITRVGVTGAKQGLFTFNPSPSDFNPGVAWVVLGPDPVAALPKSFDANFEPEVSTGGAGNPTVSNFSPPVASAISSKQVIEFDVTDTLTPLERVVVLVSYPNLRRYEVAHDGDALGPNYSNSFCQRTPITNGFHYALFRDEGWPSSPRIVPMAFDVNGNVNPITSVIYAWTLVT